MTAKKSQTINVTHAVGKNKMVDNSETNSFSYRGGPKSEFKGDGQQSHTQMVE